MQNIGQYCFKEFPPARCGYLPVHIVVLSGGFFILRLILANSGEEVSGQEVRWEAIVLFLDAGRNEVYR